MHRVDVEDETVLIVGEGLQKEDFGLHGRLEVHHEPHDAGLELPDSHGADVGVVRLYVGDEALDALGERKPFNVDHEPQG